MTIPAWLTGPQTAKSTTREKLDQDNWPDYVAEPKHDGMRALVIRTEDGVMIQSRTLKPYADHVPHLTELFMSLPVGTVLDGELAAIKDVVEVDGRMVPVVDFNRTMRAMGSNPEKAILRQSESGLVSFIMFDVLQWGVESLLNKTQKERSEYQAQVMVYLDMSIHIVQNPHYKSDFGAVYDALVAVGIEGVIMKNQKSVYAVGKRPNATWYKVKAQSTSDVVITGFYAGKGKHEGRLGGVEFSAYDSEGTLKHVGRSGGGFSDAQREEIWANQDAFKGRVIELKYNELVGSGTYRTPRHPNFVGFRIDKNAEDCSMEQFLAEE